MTPIRKDYPRYAHRRGAKVHVKAIDPPCYQIPAGLSDGEAVTVVDSDIGNYTVKNAEGRQFDISMVLIKETHLTPAK